MITLGIDLSSQPKDTAACLIDWQPGRGVVHAPALACDDATLDAWIARADATGIDAPLGWPEAFVRAVGGWIATVWGRRANGVGPLVATFDPRTCPHSSPR